MHLDDFQVEASCYPTRRSSDLRQLGACLERAARGVGRRGERAEQAQALDAPRFARCQVLADDRAERVPGEVRALDAKDRKSTRLNSSHGYISYAVFCLKKKNKY